MRVCICFCFVSFILSYSDNRHWKIWQTKIWSNLSIALFYFDNCFVFCTLTGFSRVSLSDVLCSLMRAPRGSHTIQTGHRSDRYTLWADCRGLRVWSKQHHCSRSEKKEVGSDPRLFASFLQLVWTTLSAHMTLRNSGCLNRGAGWFSKSFPL